MLNACQGHFNVCDLEHGCAVDQLLAKYDNREDELMENLRQKYEPSDLDHRFKCPKIVHG